MDLGTVGLSENGKHEQVQERIDSRHRQGGLAEEQVTLEMVQAPLRQGGGHASQVGPKNLLLHSAGNYVRKPHWLCKTEQARGPSNNVEQFCSKKAAGSCLNP